jgi:Ca2+-binding RTX toxin-like protein
MKASTNSIASGAGDDVLVGGGGTDTLNGGPAADMGLDGEAVSDLRSGLTSKTQGYHGFKAANQGCHGWQPWNWGATTIRDKDLIHCIAPRMPNCV